MQATARLDGGDWELPLTLEETRALLENIGAALKICEAFGIVAVLIGPSFVIRLEDVVIQRFGRASGYFWTALDTVGGWGSCQCEDWRSLADCVHVSALHCRAVPPAEPVADILAFPRRSS